METIKVDNNTLGVIETKPQEILPQVNYRYNFLKQQLIDIQAQKDRDNFVRDAELARVSFLIAEADRLGIMANKAAEEPINL